MDRRAFVVSGLATLALTGAATPGSAVSLRQLASARRIRFGAAIDRADIARPDAVQLFREQCSSLTPRNSLKWTAVERSAGQFDFGGADEIVDFARSIGCGVYGTALVWYRVPGWVDAIADKDELRSAMRRHIERTVQHFGDKVYAWDVVNEPFEYARPVLRDSIFQRLLGEDHVREALEIAHQANPHAQLVINETHMEKAGPMYDARRAALLQLVERLQAAKAPLHAIGLQAHFRPGLDSLDADALSALCRELKRRGVGVYVTELDASCRFAGRLRTSPDESYAEVFGGVVRAASVGDLRGVTTWGLSEKYGADEQGAKGACRTRVLPYDEAMKPRPALKALEDALAGR